METRIEELKKKLGVKDIVISHINSYEYKDVITVIINDDFILNLVGKTISFIPLNENGKNKELTINSTRKVLNTIKEQFKDITI